MLNTFILNRLGYIHKSGLHTKNNYANILIDQRVNFLGLDFKHVFEGVPNVFLVCAYIHHENQRILFDDRLYCSFGNKGILENLLIIH
ncbi:hypothetical protein Hanom_Chr11g00972361 [Helianthus anomalus]